MTSHIPVPSFRTMAMELVAVIFFSVSLWFFTYVFEKKIGFDKAISAIAMEEKSINAMKGRLHLFETLKARYMPASVQNGAPLVWQLVDIKWDDLGFEDLIYRLRSLGFREQPFVLESFSAVHEDKKGQTQPEMQGRQPVSDRQGQESGGKVIFHLKGYFLCLCR
ncbi:MAG: hypothetical protein ACUVQ2_03500 [Dissulfurimicrobium sp.]|uniref:hypothetical protein n=1 Tax=Dissulfurimicrobium sp. TaxID=2022436 RepID=UPI0040495610